MKNKYRRKGKESKRLKWTMAKLFLEVDLAYLLGGLAGQFRNTGLDAGDTRLDGWE
jgi:hypothetical protein